MGKKLTLETAEFISEHFGKSFTIILRNQMSGNRRDIEYTDELDCLPNCLETSNKIKELEYFYSDTNYEIEILDLDIYIKQLIDSDERYSDILDTLRWISFEILKARYE